MNEDRYPITYLRFAREKSAEQREILAAIGGLRAEPVRTRTPWWRRAR